MKAPLSISRNRRVAKSITEAQCFHLKDDTGPFKSQCLFLPSPPSLNSACRAQNPGSSVALPRALKPVTLRKHDLEEV